MLIDLERAQDSLIDMPAPDHGKGRGRINEGAAHIVLDKAVDGVPHFVIPGVGGGPHAKADNSGLVLDKELEIRVDVLADRVGDAVSKVDKLSLSHVLRNFSRNPFSVCHTQSSALTMAST